MPDMKPDAHKTYEALLGKAAALDPLIPRAVDEVDGTLLDEFAALSLSERVERAGTTAFALSRFKKTSCSR